MSLSRLRFLVAAVGLLAMSVVSTGSTRADDKPQAKNSASESRVVVVRVEGDKVEKGGDIAKAVAEALEGKLKDLSPAVREEIKKKLQSINISGLPVKAGYKPVVSARELEWKVQAAKAKAGAAAAKVEKPHMIVVRANDVKGVATEKQIRVELIAVKEGDSDAKDKGAKSITVRIDGDKILLNGKALPLPHDLHLSGDSDNKDAKSFTVQIKGDHILLNGKPLPLPHGVQLKGSKPAAGKSVPHAVQQHIDVMLKKAEETAKKETHQRHAVWVDKDGKKHEINVDVVVDVDKDGKTTATATAESKDRKAEKPAQKKLTDKPQVRVRAMQLGGPHTPHGGAIVGVPNGKMQIFRVEAKNLQEEAKTHKEVVKQLQAIHQELQKIRALLDKMSKK